jgi:hypothetical protein
MGTCIPGRGDDGDRLGLGVLVPVLVAQEIVVCFLFMERKRSNRGNKDFKKDGIQLTFVKIPSD